jgi:choline dehydrogenase
MLDARTLPMSHLWETEADDRSASRACILGGCSAHNACLVNALGAVRWNAAFAYLDEARSRPNLMIAAETLVDRVEIATGSGRARAVGVVSDSGRLTADTVIVAAGAYGSPALLLRSGIGPHAQLSRLGVGVIEDLPV